MGYDATCQLTIDGRTFDGKAVLEEKELVFRGDVRLAVPLPAVEKVHARDGSLFITFNGRRAALSLGAPQAEKWAKRIASPPSRIDKLGVRPGMRVALVRVKDADLAGEIESRGATIAGPRASDLDMIFFAAEQVSDLEGLRAAAGRLKPAGALWVIRAKGRGAPISERASMAAGRRAGLVDVKVVSYSGTHSAEKYLIPVAKRRG